ncbi:MAG: hypothetical protein U1D55_00050 [Phycisphaerae bacterium]
MRIRLVGSFVVAALIATAPVGAQDGRKGYSALLDNSDFLIDSYATFLIRKYNLTPEQTEATKTLIKHKAHAFLDSHNDQLRGLVDRLFEVRTGGDMSPDELVEWGRQVTPIYEEAKKLVVEGNNQWRELLSPEQKTIHDQDLQLMEQSFTTTDKQLQRITSGEMTVEEFRFPRAKPAPPPPPPQVVDLPPRESDDAAKLRAEQENSAAPMTDDQIKAAEEAKIEEAKRREAEGGLEDRIAEQKRQEQAEYERTHPREKPVAPPVQPPVQPAPGFDPPPPQPQPQPVSPPLVPPVIAVRPAPPVKPHESEWEQYVRQFIERYKLDDQQSQKAYTILNDCKAAAEKITRGNEGEIEQLDKRKTELAASKDANKAKELAKIEEQRKKLLEPLTRIFEQQLKPRLERLPTRAQRKAAEAVAKTPPAPKPKGDGKPPAEQPKAEKSDKP